MADLSLYQPHDYLYSSVAACKFCTTLSKIGFHHRSPLENNFYISTMSSDSVNRYWIPHIDIHKRVITQELQYYLGPDATVRPFTREGEDGFLITTPGACLSDVGFLWL
ncbi:hypothetical protein BJ166DRAFT_217787 [Pestalotiopsis sp. NC0098]|nr:hypothetical protein BJ166DRAFT_217787 [Pestalotiopsis sp. NC0098]